MFSLLPQGLKHVFFLSFFFFIISFFSLTHKKRERKGVEEILVLEPGRHDGLHLGLDRNRSMLVSIKTFSLGILKTPLAGTINIKERFVKLTTFYTLQMTIRFNDGIKLHETF